ncbi:Lar family restriction alleviation protein [Tyzzerella sp. OttesenSCG-928-J15]|nr:Lar family restriction alleviation protein [Tyzzerella sp. OttesenSCG-928-J15]
MPELKPCPRCGGKAVLNVIDDVWFLYMCENCLDSYKGEGTEKEAAEVWNRRA